MDYANTFPPRSDSLRYFVRKAWSLAKTPQDSVRCAFEFANIGALAANYQEYAKWRDMYDQSPFRNAVTRFAPRMLDITDDLFAGRIKPDDKRLYSLPTQNARTIAKIAENMGRHDIAEPVKDYCLDTKNKDFAELLDMQLLELDAQYGNDLLAADQAERIFERFTKLDEFVQGTGLGLSICREIADKMGGRVFLDTSYTGGARFVFILPETPAQPVA